MILTWIANLGYAAGVVVAAAPGAEERRTLLIRKLRVKA